MSNTGESSKPNWTKYLQKGTRLPCLYCKDLVTNSDKEIETHLSEKHPEILLAGKENGVKAFRKIGLHSKTTSQSSASSAAPESEPVTTQERSLPDVKDAGGTEPSPNRATKSQGAHSRPCQKKADPTSLNLVKQPHTQPISQEQLVAEVKGIYAGLVMVESKCIEVDNAQSTQDAAKLNNEQWQALVVLHRSLLHEHHDFLLASQHPSADPALRRLASKYSMPARMWRHGIHSFLELLRHHLPASLEHMLTFVYMAYSMLALLYETVPAFEATWVECLGDVGRYRMAIEDSDIREREVWTSVSRHWYSKASDMAPTTGRFYHHLAILARPNALRQLFYYAKSLCAAVPFASARESIMTLFDPVLDAATSPPPLWLPADVVLVKAHGILFSRKMTEEYASTVAELVENLDNHIGRTTRWMEAGYLVAIANFCLLLSYGQDDNLLCRILRSKRAGEAAEAVDITKSSDEKTGKQLEQALHLTDGTHEKVFCRFADPNILPYVHVVLVFMSHLKSHPTAMELVSDTFPWKLLSELLNALLLTYRNYDGIQKEEFPRPEKGSSRPLPEDFAMRGLLWVDTYFPPGWLPDRVDYDEKYFEVASMTEERKERVLWLGVGLAKPGRWLVYDETVRRFAVTLQVESKSATRKAAQGREVASQAP